MHILHIETGRHLYGGAQQVAHLLRGLAGRGIANTLVCPPGSAISTAVNAAEVRVRTLPMAGDLDALFAMRLTALLAADPPDLVHVHSRRGADIWGGLAARRAGVPAVLSRRVDNPDPPLVGPLRYRLYDRVIAISGRIGALLRESGVPAAKLRTVLSAVDAAACQPVWSREQFRAAFGLPGEELAVVCVAQMIPRKGHDSLLEAWPRVLAARADARLILFGRGPQEAALRDQAQRLGIESAVRFAGFRADLLEFLGHADLLVHPALREGLGICLLEAQAAGLPVVASHAGGIPEAVADGLTGILVPPARPDELAAALVDLLGDDAKRRQLGAAGPDWVARNFSIERMVSGNLEVYEEHIGSVRI